MVKRLVRLRHGLLPAESLLDIGSGVPASPWESSQGSKAIRIRVTALLVLTIGISVLVLPAAHYDVPLPT